MKRRFTLLLAILLITSLVAAGCGGSTPAPTTAAPTTAAPTTAPTEAPSTDVVFNWNIGADPKTIDPVLNGASDGGDVINQTFEGLIREQSGTLLPGIAESWEVSEDGLTVTFKLRESKWSDGSDLTAHDFVHQMASYKMILFNLYQLWRYFLANLLTISATTIKSTFFRWINRAFYITL